MLLVGIEKVIAFLKKDDTYKIDPNYSVREIWHIVYYRGLQILRGLRMRLKLGSSKGIVFCGRSVIIEYGFLITAKSGLILEDGVKLNALSKQGIQLGHNVSIGKDTIMVCTGVVANKGIGIKIGNNSGIGSQCFFGGQGGIKIGNDVIMGPGVKLFSENHNYTSHELPIRKQGENRKGIIIENNCWIGAASTILDGVSIGSGSVIAAGSVVTRSVPSNSIVAGVPAKVIKTRS